MTLDLLPAREQRGDTPFTTHLLISSYVPLYTKHINRRKQKHTELRNSYRRNPFEVVEQKNIPIMTRHHFLPLPGALCLLLAVTTLGGSASAAKYEYTNLHRDVYLDLIGQSSPFASEAALSTLKAALKSYGPTFVTKFSECVAEFTNGDTKVDTMAAPSWKVYSSARQYPNANGDGYLQQVQWKSAEVIFAGDEDVSDDDVDRCTRRAFNIGKSLFVPLLLEEDAAVGGDGAFQGVQKAKVVAMADFSPPPASDAGDTDADTETDANATAEDVEAETANDVLADSELVQDTEEGAVEKPAEKDPAPQEEEQEASNGDLPRCPVKLEVDCRSSDLSRDCNDVPMPENPDCKIKVRFTYKFTAREEIRLQSAKRYRKGSYQGCDKFGEKCEIRDYLEKYEGMYLREGTKFDAWEEVSCGARGYASILRVLSLSLKCVCPFSLTLYL